MKNLFKKLRKLFCMHHYATGVEYNAVTGTIKHWGECIKCGKVK